MSALTDALAGMSDDQRRTLRALTAVKKQLLEELRTDVTRVRNAANLEATVSQDPEPGDPAAVWKTIEAKGYRKGVAAAFVTIGRLLDLHADECKAILDATQPEAS